MARLPPSSRLGHARALDGLRGVAVLLVLAHNFDWPWLAGGFFGVDVFFALSGFLITTLLLEDYLDHGSISLRHFFGRRAIRLYPALVVLVAMSVVSSVVRPEVDAERVRLVLGSVLLYLSNWLLIADSEAWLGGMGHTWSLAVEVHFYLVWALVVAMVVRRRGLDLRLLATVAIGIILISAAWRALVWADSASLLRPYAGTDTRLDALFFGVLAAVLRLQLANAHSPSPLTGLSSFRVGLLEAFLGLGALGLVVTSQFNSPWVYLGGFGVVGGATAVLILTTLLHPGSLLAPMLERGSLVWLGRISYSLYLWHLPLGKFATPERLARWGTPGWLIEPARFLLALVFAVASYYCVERLFLRLKPRRPPAVAAPAHPLFPAPLSHR